MGDGPEIHFEAARLRRIVNRFSYIGLTIVDITSATMIWSANGYLDLQMLAAVWVLLIAAGISLIASAMKGAEAKTDYLFIALLVPSVAAVFAALLKSFPVFGTDELAIDTYSAYIFIHGLNPYSNGNLINVFNFYHVPLYFITPVLTGGYVHYLTYPGLSVLLFVPAVLLGVQSSIMLILFNLAALVVLFLYYRKRKFTDFYPYAAFALLININWIYYSVGGVTDIVWVVLVALAYVYRSDVYASGALFGLAVAFKQTPALLFPFFLYFLYMEGGRSARRSISFAGATAAGFLLPNIPFIMMSPVDWLHNVAGVASQPIVGIGLGPSILAFTGVLQIASIVFFAIPALILAACFVVYVSNYDRMKYAFFAFPVIAFVFYYRLLLNYIIYWPFLVLLLLPDLLHEISVTEEERMWPLLGIREFLGGIGRKKVEAALLVLILVAGTAVTTYGFVTGSKQVLRIDGIGGFADTAQTGTSVTSMNVTLSYTPQDGGPRSIPVFFRILTDSPIISANGLLWTSPDPNIGPGTSNLTIIPLTVVDYLPFGVSFRLIAYYGSYQAEFSSAPVQPGSAPLFVNPYMVTPAADRSEAQPPGWQFTPDTAGGTASYSVIGTELTLNASKTVHGTAWAVSQFTNTGINLSGLAGGGYTLSYSIQIEGGTPGSNVTRSGFPDIFYGVQLQFAGDLKQIWIGYNASANYSVYRPDANVIVVITNMTVVNFTAMEALASSAGWPTARAGFAYLAGSWTQPGSFGAKFNSLLLKGFRT